MDPLAHPLYEWLKELRQDFHRHPELSMEEKRTTEKIKGFLSEYNVPLQELSGVETGAVGVIRGKKDGPTLAIRADIDALPLHEENDEPYCSTCEGCMHACGHDAHTAVLLGVVRTVVKSGLSNEMKGNLKFIFQPAEERVQGAVKMIQAGVMEDPHVDRIIACHVWPGLEVGQIGLHSGVTHASADRFTLEIRGKGAHGAMPEEGNDPVVAGAHFVTAVQSIVSRNISPTVPAVVTIGRFQSGTAANIIPETASLEGTVRAMDPDIRELIKTRLADLVSGLERSFGIQTDYVYTDGVPPCRNEEALTEEVSESAARVIGRENIFTVEPTMGAEDFALFADLVPGSMYRLGTVGPEKGRGSVLHSPFFDLDEACLPFGVEIFMQCIRDFLC